MRLGVGYGRAGTHKEDEEPAKGDSSLANTAVVSNRSYRGAAPGGHHTRRLYF